MAPPMVPGFSRVEIRTRDKADIRAAIPELRKLADELETIAATEHYGEDQSVILAHHRIRETSQKLRGAR